MRKTLPILLFVLFFTTLTFGQTPSPPCPSIVVSGSPGTPTGNREAFSVSVGKEMELYQPAYKWSVSNGQIIVGPDSKTIEVVSTDFINRNLTVTVDIGGLPPYCPNRASETMSYDPAPEATKLAEIKGSLAKASPQRYDKILAALRQNPSARLYIIVSAGKTNSASIIKKKTAVMKGFGTKLGEDTRVTFVDSDKGDDKVAFWLVPAGADSPVP